jgi:hypothetical protein
MSFCFSFMPGLPEQKKKPGKLGGTVELHLSRITGMASNPDMQQTWKTGFFFENKLYWQYEVQLLQSTACTCA